MTDRHTMTPVEFDAAKRELLASCPYLSETSGYRSKEHNAAVGGHPESKHLYGLAQDFVDEHHHYEEPARVAVSLGLWVKVTDGYLHVQGAAPGPQPWWWRQKYAPEELNDG